MQLLLPDIRFDVARALLEFLYTGDLRRPLDLDSPLPYDLRDAAKTYGVQRLEALCADAIALGTDPGKHGGEKVGAGAGRERWGQVGGWFATNRVGGLMRARACPLRHELCSRRLLLPPSSSKAFLMFEAAHRNTEWTVCMERACLKRRGAACEVFRE